MKIKKIQIINYRSIADLQIEISESPIILVGINESGKTNILSALSLLSPENIPTIEDIREPLPDEKPVHESCIRFELELDECETHNIFENIKSKFFL